MKNGENGDHSDGEITPEHYDPTDEDLLAATTGDFHSLPPDKLFVSVSRTQDEVGQYWTDINVSRPVRRFYLIGLLTEALSILSAASFEFVLPSDHPSVEESDDDDFEEVAD
jgi:hypothetical protein